MPVYEYRCGDCQKRSSIFFRSLQDKIRPVCPFCNHGNLNRIFSRFAMVRSEEDRLHRLADPSRWGSLDESDPKSIAQFTKRMGKEMGEEMGDDFDQMVDKELETDKMSPDDSSSED
ncbi:zinc ribbon domain-containing protein [bacterium]|nr:zinc ribbon domain-containing protein [bacterium]